MDDNKIVKLFLDRKEEAVTQTFQKYGRYCEIIASNIIGNHEDAEECVNDTLLCVWNAIPPNEPKNLRTFVGKILRNNALNVVKKMNRQKRSGGEIDAIYDELSELSSDYSVETAAEQNEITAGINEFLNTLPDRKRKVFVLRYWHCCEVSEIAGVTGLTEANVYNILKRERKKLLEFLKKRGVLE